MKDFLQFVSFVGGCLALGAAAVVALRLFVVFDDPWPLTVGGLILLGVYGLLVTFQLQRRASEALQR